VHVWAMSDIEESELSSWLKRTLKDFGGMTCVQKFSGGQSNPTYRIDTVDRSIVLRRKPFGQLLPSAHAIEREYRVLSVLQRTGFPVPRPLALCEDVSVLGSAFYVMEMVEGYTYWDGTLPEVPKTARRAHYEALIDTLAELHTLDYERLGLGDFGRSGSYVERQTNRWVKQYRATQTDDLPEMERLIDWLPRTVPAEARRCIVHGDYRIDNLIYAPDRPQIRAVLDWELATLGDPIADFAYLAMNWVLPQDGRSGLAGLDFEEQGLPTLEQLVSRYCTASGNASAPNLHWYFAYNLFRMAGILQGVKKRYINGNASSQHASNVAAKIPIYAQAAWREARKAGAAG
jgi:aminoglycoside phosphotransferase (APT) family kinase protein